MANLRHLSPVAIPATVTPGMTATFLPWPIRQPHKWKQLGVVIVHDAKTEITFNEFDYRYRGKKSRFGRYLRDLHAKGVDVTGLTKLESLEKEKEELALTLAKRLYGVLGKRTVYERKQCTCGIKPATIVKAEDKWDWNSPAVKHSKYYKMAVRILNENDEDSAIRIVNTITGYA